MDWNYDMTKAPHETRVLLYFKGLKLVTLGMFHPKPYKSRGSCGWRASLYPGNSWAWMSHPTAWAAVPVPEGVANAPGQ